MPKNEMKPKLKIKEVGKRNLEIQLDGEPVKLKYLKEVNLNMNAEKGNTLMLTYHVRDVEIETDNAEVETLNEE